MVAVWLGSPLLANVRLSSTKMAGSRRPASCLCPVRQLSLSCKVERESEQRVQGMPLGALVYLAVCRSNTLAHADGCSSLNSYQTLDFLVILQT